MRNIAHLVWSALQVTATLAVTAWLGLVIVNAQHLLKTREARSLAAAVAAAARMPIW